MALIPMGCKKSSRITGRQVQKCCSNVKMLCPSVEAS